MAKLFAITAIALYLLSTFRQIKAVTQSQGANRNQVIGLGMIATVFHGAAWFTPMLNQDSIALGFFSVGSLIALVISALIVLSAIKQPIENLLLGVFPMSALLLSVNLFVPEAQVTGNHWNNGLTSHIILSIMAYSILTIAAFQAILLMVQNYQLKHKHMSGIMRVLPPLQTMDRLLFQMLSAGTVLLTLAIASGFLFLDDLFAQHLLHKTLFTLISWAIFSFLLFAHWRFGWRGTVASKWTLTAMSFLVLAFFGSKLVLEIILQRA